MPGYSKLDLGELITHVSFGEKKKELKFLQELALLPLYLKSQLPS